MFRQLLKSQIMQLIEEGTDFYNQILKETHSASIYSFFPKKKWIK